MFAVSSRGFASFDRRIIKRNWKKINESPIKKAGLYIRKIAIRSIRRDKTKHGNRPSKPGKPPRTRAPGDPFRRIYSVPDLFGVGAIIGPLGFGGPHPVTELHEFGGYARRRVLVDVPGHRGQLRTGRGRFTGKRLRRPAIRIVRYPKRTYMRTALAKARQRQKLPPLWRRSLN